MSACKNARVYVQSLETDICLVSVAISADLFFFLIPRKTLVSVNPVEKCSTFGMVVFIQSPFVFLSSPMAAFQISAVSFPCNFLINVHFRT